MQQANNHPDTYKHLVMTWLGYLYVPPNHLQVVCKDGAFHGYLTTGYHRPKLWQMSYPEQINVGSQAYSTEITKLRALDGGDFTAQVKVKYRFDPRNIEWDAIQAQLSLKPENIIHILHDRIENCLREAFSEYAAHTIQHGSMRSVLQRRCKHLLMSVTPHLGLHIGDVLLTTITAPKVVEKRTNEAVSRMIAADYLRDAPQESLLQLLIAQMPDILEKSELSLNMKGADDLIGAVKKLIKQFETADDSTQTVVPTGTHTRIMTDTRNGSSTLH